MTKSKDKYVVKVFNSSEFHLSEMTLFQNPYFSFQIFLFLLQAVLLIILYNIQVKWNKIASSEIIPLYYV